MAALDQDLLSAHVTSLFDSLARGVHDAYAITTVSNTIMESVRRAAQRAVRERLCVWNENNTSCRVPLELLAAAFRHLSFRDKIVASHVSRSWRSAATDFPAVWAHIDLRPVRGASRLLQTALNRAGNLPVDFSFGASFGLALPAAYGDVEYAVGQQHLHRFRSIIWQAGLEEQNSTWNKPAPLLEHLSCRAPFVISSNFLGRQPGRLKELELGEIVLSELAPALDTVTSLSGTATRRLEAATDRLFDVFPRLESLTLRDVRHGAADAFPNRPAPLSLTKLHLQTTRDADDAIRLYNAWKTERLSQVTIYTEELSLERTPLLMEPLLVDARHLSLDVVAKTTEPRLVVVDARGHIRTLVLTQPLYRYLPAKPFELVNSILHVGLAIALLESLEMALTDFLLFMRHPQCPKLTALKSVTVHMHDIPSLSGYIRSGMIAGRTSRVFPWRDLDDLKQLHLHLQSFILHVRCLGDGQLPTHRDALELFERLPSAVRKINSSVYIRGFPEDAVRGIDTNSVPGMKIMFET